MSALPTGHAIVLRAKRLLRPLRHSNVALAVDRLEGIVNRDVHAGRLPPYTLRGHVGPASTFHAAGAEFFACFRDRAKLEPHESVFDFGCGVGRLALPLEGWLEGPYLGIDVNRRSIDWCRAHITPRHPNFRFETADMYNRRYNPGGRVRPEDYRFPLETVDFAFAASVFTHLRPREASHFLGELGRVAPRCLITWFLIEEENPAFTVSDGPARYANAAVPEEMVGYERSWVDAELRAAGFSRVEVHPGTWDGTPGLSYQDITVAWKT